MFQEERMIAFSNDVERCSDRGRKVYSLWLVVTKEHGE